MKNLILVVEDNDDDVLVIKRGFKKSQISNSLHCVTNGQEAIEFIEQNLNDKIELVLLDLNMEVMNGFEFLRVRQKSELAKKIPTVVLTSSHRTEDIDLAYELGANAYVEKPVNPKEFINTIISIDDFWLTIAKKPE